MDERILTISDLRRQREKVAGVDFPVLVPASGQLNAIRDNTFVEDTVRGNPQLLTGSIAERVQRLTDLSNRFDLIDQQLKTTEERFLQSPTNRGRGIVSPGRQAQIVTEQRVLGAEQRNVLAQIEELRGNIQTARSLRSEASRLASATSGSDFVIQGIDRLAGGTQIGTNADGTVATLDSGFVGPRGGTSASSRSRNRERDRRTEAILRAQQAGVIGTSYTQRQIAENRSLRNRVFRQLRSLISEQDPIAPLPGNEGIYSNLQLF